MRLRPSFRQRLLPALPALLAGLGLGVFFLWRGWRLLGALALLWLAYTLVVLAVDLASTFIELDSDKLVIRHFQAARRIPREDVAAFELDDPGAPKDIYAVLTTGETVVVPRVTNQPLQELLDDLQLWRSEPGGE